MPKVQFLEDYDYKPMPQQTVEYKAGEIYLVTQEVAEVLFQNKVVQDAPEDSEVKDSGINETIKKYKKPTKTSTKREPEEITEAPTT